MKDNIIKFYSKDNSKNPDHILEKAKGIYESVIILGWDNNGLLNARATTNIDNKDILWLLSLFKHKLLNGDYSE